MRYSIATKLIKLRDNSLLLSLVLTFVVAMNYTVHTIGGVGLLLPFNNSTWLAISIALFIGLVSVSLVGRVYLSKATVAYLFCLFMLFIPIVYQKKPMDSDSLMVISAVLLSYLLLFIFAQKHNKSFKKRVICILLISCLVQSLWGLFQYYFIFERGPLFFGAERGLPLGTFSQQNVLATYTSFGSMLAIYFLFNSQRKSRLLICFTFAVLIINAHLGMLANAKTGRVVPLIAIGLYLLFYVFRDRQKALPAALFIVCLLTSFLPKDWFDVRPGQTAETTMGIKSFGARPFIYKLGVELALEEPITGHGMGSVAYEFAMKKARHEKMHGVVWPGEQITDHIHSEPLQWLIQLGVVSGLSFVSFILVWIYGLFKGWFEPTILLLALPFVGHSLLEFPFYHSAPHLLAFSIILGVAIKKPGKKVTFSSVLSGIFVPFFGYISYKIISFMLLSLASLSTLVSYRMGAESDVSLLYSVEPTSTFEPFFLHEKYEWKLKTGMQKGSVSKEDVFGFINFLETRRKIMPEALLYIQLSELYAITGQQEKSLEIMLEANFLFPSNEKIIVYFENKE